MPSSRNHRIAEAVAVALVLGAGCGPGGAKPSVQTDGAVDRADVSSERHTDAAGDGPADVVAGRCCVLQPSDASSPLGGGLDNDATLGVSEPCLKQNSHGTYGRWTCGAGAEPQVCSNNGLSCGVGDPCTLVDVGCPGVVQTCESEPSLPPPG